WPDLAAGGPMSGVATRIATGLVLAPLVILAVLYLPPLAFALLVSVMMLAAFWEWSRLSGLPGRPLRAAATVGLAAVFAAMAWASHDVLPIVAMVACVFWLFALAWLGNAGFGARDTWTNRLLKVASGVILLC